MTLQLNKEDKEDVVVDHEKYQCLVGKLIYLSHTWPNIAYAVSVVSQFMHSPGEIHLKALYKILRYLKVTLRKGILFGRNRELTLEAYTNVDWGGLGVDRRLISGFCTFFFFFFLIRNEEKYIKRRKDTRERRDTGESEETREG